MPIRHDAVAILPSTDLDRSEAFYNRLGFFSEAGERPEWAGEYRILHDATGASVHLSRVAAGSMEPEKNMAAIYFYIEDVDGLASKFPGEILERSKAPENKPWSMYEFALSDPDGALVRIGWPVRLRT